MNDLDKAQNSYDKQIPAYQDEELSAEEIEQAERDEQEGKDRYIKSIYGY